MGCGLFKIYFIFLLTARIWQEFSFFPSPLWGGDEAGLTKVLLSISNSGYENWKFLQDLSNSVSDCD